jgi:hypothetical protein
MKKQPLALRIDADLLNEARRCAAEENRTLTNLIETLLKARIARGPSAPTEPPSPRAAISVAPDVVPPSELKANAARRRRAR